MVGGLADSLGIHRFAVWGYSGGGPYAAACAAVLPNRVTKAAVSAGMGQMGVWAKAEDFEKTDRQMLGLAVKHPAIARTALGFSGWLARRSPKTAIKSFEKQMNDSDRAVVEGPGSPGRSHRTVHAGVPARRATAWSPTTSRSRSPGASAWRTPRCR